MRVKATVRETGSGRTRSTAHRFLDDANPTDVTVYANACRLRRGEPLSGDGDRDEDEYYAAVASCTIWGTPPIKTIGAPPLPATESPRPTPGM